MVQAAPQLPDARATVLGEPLLRISWTRAVAALRRYKWLAALVVLAGTALGYLAARSKVPVYAVNSTVWISTEHEERNPAPIRAGEVMRETSWPDLLTSYAILDRVVRKLSLNVYPERSADTSLLKNFAMGERFQAGTYELKTESGWRYRLVDDAGKTMDAGIIGDSIGRKLGFLWKPDVRALPKGRSVKFSVLTPRVAAISLRDNILTSFPRESNILRVTLNGTDPQRITLIMSTLLDEFIAAATELKRHSATEAGKALAQQVDVAGRQLRDAESALEVFRVQTITLPTEGQTPGPDKVGQPAGRDPMFDNFFMQRMTADNLRRERAALETTLASVQQGRLDPSTLWNESVIQNSSAPELKAALSDYSAKQAALRAAQRTYTDDHNVVRDLKVEIEELRTQAIPRYVGALIAEQRRREQALDAQVATTAAQLRGIPTRTTEETRLRREVESRGELYTSLKNRFEEAKLAEATTVPDVSVLDSPVAPQSPLRNRGAYLVVMAFMASIAAAIGLALLLDQVDKRFRYAEQATQDMGLDIIGVVPALTQTAPELRDPVEAAHAREAFRTIRLAVMHSFENAGRSILTVSSPGAGDGKSLLSSNLAMSFAEANCRTLLIDGDIRRGELHKRFGVDRLPGFVDYLAGGHSLDAVLRATRHERLTLLPRGASQLHGPELLLSPATADLIAELERSYDVVIVDSPPLGAGIDPFVLGTATGSILLVLRSGETDRRIAQAKLKVLSRLPVKVLGAVLNATRNEGDFGYYSYLYSDLEDDDVRDRTRDRLRHPIPAVPGADTEVPTIPLQAS